MKTFGMNTADAETNLKARRTAYNKAMREYDKALNPIPPKKATTRARKPANSEEKAFESGQFKI